ncbi:D-alanyl-D-alanine carboxypeptidase [Spirochaetia bacterium]|nr:D-alanyl-D-alanine carboxypeptidase [Spirochaetia bacterium]
MKLPKQFFSILLIIATAGLLAACLKPAPSKKPVNAAPELADAIAQLSAASDRKGAGGDDADEFRNLLEDVLISAGIPPELSQKLETAAKSPAFILDLWACLEGDPYLRMLVDKQHPLPAGYEPDDLVELKGGSYQIGRKGLMLRRAAAEALEEMAAAAKADGVTLIASSSYRSYDYQVEVYDRIVKEMGQEAADRESARPGHSQHQTGLVVDFGSIDDSFAETAAGRWIEVNGSRFGWSISFPDGYEEVTGYRWESWHYRYVGRDLAAFIATWFEGVQQYALQFIYEWEKAGA